MTYKTINLNEPKCYIWFFEDVSHLLKTARNCIYHLSNGNGTGFMWKERNFILWDRLYKILDQNGRLLLILVSRIQCFLDLKCTFFIVFARAWLMILCQNSLILVSQHQRMDGLFQSRVLEYRHKENNQKSVGCYTYMPCRSNLEGPILSNSLQEGVKPLKISTFQWLKTHLQDST